MLTTETKAALEPGDRCPEPGCTGHLDVGVGENCYCHLSAPCHSCVSAPLVCDVCETPAVDE